MSAPLNILMFEPNADNATVALTHLRKHGRVFDCTSTTSVDELDDALRASHWDVLICNPPVPGADAEAMLGALREKYPLLPVIAVSPGLTETQAAKLIRAGAHDAVNSNKPARLFPAIERELNRRGLWEQADRSRQRFGNIVEQSIVGIAVRNRLGLLFANDAYCRIFDCTAAELADEGRFFELYHPDERDKVRGYVKARQSGDDSAHRYETRGLRKDGSVFWVEHLASVVDWDGQRATQILAIDVTERKEAEHRIAEQEQKYREVFDLAPIAMFRSGADGTFVETNRAFQELLGYSAHELAGKRGRDFTPPEESAVGLPLINELWSGKVDRCEFEHRLIRKDGATVWVQISASIAPGDERQPPSMIVHAQDVTARRNAEASIKERDALYRSLVENSIQGVLVAKRGKPLFVNGVAAEMFGYTVDEILAMPSTSEIYHPSERERHREFIDSRQQGDTSVRHFVAHGVRKDGSTLWTEQLSSIIGWRGQTATQIVIVDITERKLAQERLAAQEKSHREAFDSAPVAICWLDWDAKVLAANPALATLLGYAHSELIGACIWDLMPEADRHDSKEKVLQAFAGGHLHGVELEHRLIRKDGGTIWVHGWASAILDDSGKTSRAIVHFQDVSEQRKAQRHFQNLVEGSIQGILVRARSKTVFVNDAICRMFGYRVEELLGADSLLPLHAPGEHARLKELIMRRRSGDASVHHFEAEALRKDGTTFWVEQLVSMAEWQGEPAIQFVMVGIGERKQAERKLTDRERKYRETFENAPVAMFRTARERPLIECNRAFHELVGYSREELEGIPTRGFIHPEDEPKVLERTALVWNREAARIEIEYRLVRKDGKVLWVMGSACLVPDDEGKQDHLLVQILDITARREAEIALHEREAQYRNLVDRSIQGMMILDGSKPLFVNSVFAERYGYTVDEILSLDSSLALFHPDEHAGIQRNIETRRAGDASVRRFERRGISKDGNELWTEQLTSTVDWHGKQAVQLASIDITERKLAEMALAEREKRYRGLADNSLQGLLVMSTATVTETLFVNDAFCSMFGYTVEEYLALPEVYVCYHPDDREFLRGFAAERRRGDPAKRRFEIRGLRKDGSTLWIEQMSSLIDWQGIPAVQVVTVDITERKLAEQRLATTAKKFREIFYTAPVPMFRSSRGRKFLETNRALQQLTGYSADELLEKGPGDLSTPEDSAAAHHALERLWRGDTDRVDLQFRLNCKDGRQLWVSTSASLAQDDDGQQYLICVMEDVTRRREAELRLADSERQYRGVFANAPIAMYRSNYRTIIEVNRAFETLLGYSAKEIIGRSRRDLMPKEDAEKTIHFTDEGTKIGENLSAEHRMIRKDGSTIWVIASGSTWTTEGDTPSMVVHLQDITARKMAEEQLFQSQKMEALGNLAGGIAHDFNNMLLPIIALTELTHDELAPGNPLRENMATVLQAANQASGLVKQILTFSRQDEREVAALDISHCIAGAIELLRNVLPATIKVTPTVPPGVGVVMGDLAQLNSVIMNLGSNAADAMGGKVGFFDLGLARVTADVTLTTRIPDLVAGHAYAKISIRDTGCGMDQATIEKIFNPFFTTKAPGEGTGLGLAMVHGIIERHSGAIDVTSELGVGTTFDIYLPLEEAGEQAASKPMASAVDRVLARAAPALRNIP